MNALVRRLNIVCFRLFLSSVRKMLRNVGHFVLFSWACCYKVQAAMIIDFNKRKHWLVWSERSYQRGYKTPNKRLYFIVLLKRARVPDEDRYHPVLLYALDLCTWVLCASFSPFALKVLKWQSIEMVHKRVFSILSPGNSYQFNLNWKIPTTNSS